MHLSSPFTFFVLVLSSVNAFQPALRAIGSSSALTATKKSQNPMEQILRTLANNFEPIHGHGSLEDDLEDQWQAQQELLKARRSKNIDKEHLKQKYKDPEARKTFDLNVGLQAGASKSKKKFFWDKNISP